MQQTKNLTSFDNFDERKTTANSTYKKLAVEWFNEALLIGV